jgi:propionyl-CoA carboxylase beta chain
MVTRNYIDKIFDRGSFMEIGEGMKSSVVTGYGRIGDKMVYAFLQDSEREGGAFSKTAAEKIRSIYNLALKARIPVIGLLDSTGYLIDEGAEALNGFSEVYALANKAMEDLLQNEDLKKAYLGM